MYNKQVPNIGVCVQIDQCIGKCIHTSSYSNTTCINLSCNKATLEIHKIYSQAFKLRNSHFGVRLSETCAYAREFYSIYIRELTHRYDEMQHKRTH